MRQTKVVRLRAIMERAGPASTLIQDLTEKYRDHATSMATIVLGRGAPRTLRSHIDRWRRFEEFINTNSQDRPDAIIYPPNHTAVGLYLEDRLDAKAGWTVPASILGTVKWMCDRLLMVAPQSSCHGPHRDA